MNRLSVVLLNAMLFVTPLVASGLLFAQDSEGWLGKEVFFKEEAKAKIGDKIIDKYEVLAFPAKVTRVNGDWLWLGRAWLKKSDVMEVDEALATFELEIKRDPKQVKGWGRRAACYMLLGKYELAVKDYDEVIRLAPNSAGAFNGRGMAKSELKDYAGAIKDYDQAIKLNGKLAWAYNNRGLAKRYLKEYASAIEDYNDAIRLDPKYATAFNNRGAVKYEQKQYEAAIQDYEEAIRLDKYFAWPHNNIGFARRAMNDLTGALAAYDQAIELDPKYSLAYRNRGDIKRDLGKFDEAILDYEQAMRLSPNDAWPVFNRAIVKLIRRDQSAAQGFQEVIKLQGWQGDRSVYAAIFGYFAAKLTGNTDSANKFLEAAKGKVNQEWPVSALAYLRGEINEEALLKQADNQDKETEARCYIGLNKLASNENEAAQEQFQWIKEKGNRIYTEYTVGAFEAQRSKD